MPWKLSNTIGRRRSCRAAAFMLIIISLLLFMSPPAASAGGGKVHVVYVYSPSCTACEHSGPVVRETVSESRKAGFDVQYDEYAIGSREGMGYVERFGIDALPAVIIDEHAIRFEDFNGDAKKLGDLMKQGIAEASRNESPAAPERKISGAPAGLSMPAAFLAGLAAGINPCLLAVMAFVTAMALSIRGRRLDVIFHLMAFCGGLLSIYLIMGIGFLRIIESLPSLTAFLKAGIVTLLLALAALAFYEAYQLKKNPGRRSLFRSFLDRYEPLYRRYCLAANFGLGGAFGLVKMPCVGGMYLAILGAILESSEARSSLLYLASYNLGVVLPVLALGMLLALGLSPGKVDGFRRRHRFTLKLATGAVLLAMSWGFIFNII